MSRATNTDFRLLVNQIDKDVLAEAQPRKKKVGKASTSAKERHKQRYIQILKRQKQREKSNTNEIEKQHSFRDRAAERREKLNEYAAVAKECETIQNVTEEESKYLGGDIEHTHLVKGLDFVLLSKVRSEIEQKEAEIAAVQSLPPPSVINTTRAASPSNDSSKIELANKICNELVSGIHPHHTAYEQKLNKIDAVVLRGAQFRSNTKNFLPYRMSYVFRLSGSSTTPITVFQSTIEESRHQQPVGCIAPVHWRIAKHVNDIFDAKKQKASESREENEECLDAASVSRQFQQYLSTFKPFSFQEDVPRWTPEPTQVQKKFETEAEDDIFSGVGGFVPESIPISESATETEILENKPNYFDEDVDENNNNKNINVDNTNKKEGVISMPTFRSSGSVSLSQKVARVDDYSECYPDLGQHSDDDELEGKKKRKAIIISDDEKKKPKMTSRAQRRQQEREWKKLEGYIESKTHRDLNEIEKQMDRKSGNNNNNNKSNKVNYFPAVL